MTLPKSNLFWFSLLVLVILIFWGLTFDAQPYLSSDDMGKDLYPFELTFHGQWPCRDYWWQYGPVMPLYYAFWFLVGGVNLISVRIGLAVNYLLCSVIAYRTLRQFVSPVIAFLASLAFLVQEYYYPYYNFNHIGAVPFLLISIFSLWKFFLSGRIRWCYFGTLALVGVAWVKSNVGVFAFLAFFVSLWLYGDASKRKQFIFLFPLFGLVALAGYLTLYVGLPIEQIDHCLTARPVYREFPSATLWTHFKHLVQWFWVWDRKRLGWLTLFLIFGALGLLGMKKNAAQGQRKILHAAVLSLLWYGLFSLNDFFLIGQIYRVDFWSFPLLVLFMGLSAEWAGSLAGRLLRICLGVLIFLGVLWFPVRYLREAFAAKVPGRFLDFPRGRVFLTRETDDTVEAIRKGTRFILENTRPGDEILVIPRDPIYCFLSGRRQATGEIDFELTSLLVCKHREDEFISRLEAQQVPLVILSNRDGSNPLSTRGVSGTGYFGRTHCRKLGEYISEHYQEVETFGVWEADKPRIHHAIKVLKRK